MQSYLLTVYIPSSLLVLIAWVSFWIDAKVAPARVALGITTVLTITTMTSGILESLPVITYAKAIDYWLAVCLMFVISALLEFAYANHLVGEEAKQLNKRKSLKLAELRDADEKVVINMDMIALEYYQESKHLTATQVDKYTRIVYPLLFLLFNIIYWSYYLYSGNLNLILSGLLNKNATTSEEAQQQDETSTSEPSKSLVFDAF